MAQITLSAIGDIIDKNLPYSQTAVELLKLTYDCRTNDTVQDIHRTYGDDIMNHLLRPSGSSPENDRSQSTSMQIIFINSLRENGCTTKNLKIEKQTLKDLCIHLGIQSQFIDGVLIPSIWSKQSGGSFRRHNHEGDVYRIDAFYEYFNEWDLGPLHVWLSYDISSKSITYLLIDCPNNVKKTIIANSKGGEGCFLHQPLAIDLLIAEECASWREQYIFHHYKQIFAWHDKSGGMNPPLRKDVANIDGLQDLHSLSRTWNMLYQDLGDLEERLEFLSETAHKLEAVGIEQTISTKEALNFLRGRTHLRRRWVTSFGGRTKLIMQFLFSIASQNNNQTNLEIAGLTTTIAEETAKDNSSMITIATMTMLFLPGTFVSAIFSMVFFTLNVSADGSSSISATSQLWLFFAITVPLTLLVMGGYHFWRRRREAKKLLDHQSMPDLEKGHEIRC